MMVCLSFVGNWAMLFRLGKQNPVYTDVIENLSQYIFPAEGEVMGLLNQHGFKLVNKKEAATPIAMNFFNTDKAEARLYHAIISDDGIVPKVLE